MYQAPYRGRAWRRSSSLLLRGRGLSLRSVLHRSWARAWLPRKRPDLDPALGSDPKNNTRIKLCRYYLLSIVYIYNFPDAKGTSRTVIPNLAQDIKPAAETDIRIDITLPLIQHLFPVRTDQGLRLLKHQRWHCGRRG